MVYDTYKSSIMPYYSSGDHDENHIKSRVINPPKRVLQGPRPPPLKVIKDSSCTKSINKNKPNAVIAAAIDHYNSPHHQLIGTRRCNGSDRRCRPLVIHLKSPKVIHTRPQDFMILVQRLTGKQSSSSSSAAASSTDHKFGSSSSSVSTTMIVNEENKYKEITKKDIREVDHDDHEYLMLQLSNSTNGGGGGVSSLKASNIFSPASLFGSTGFMSSSPNNIIACTNSHWHDEFGT